MNRACDTVVIGAGPAGLAASRELARRGVAHVVLEQGRTVGHTWANFYDSLVLHTGRHLSALPGMAFPAGTPLFPHRDHFIDYLHRYAAAFRLPVHTGAAVTRILRDDRAWTITTAAGDHVRARAVVMATGIAANPYVPVMAGRHVFAGPVEHAVEYRRPAPYLGQRVLVVGAGNSAGEIAAELAAAGVHVTIAVRSGARVVPRQLLGVPIHYLAVALHLLPRAAQRVIAEGMARASERMRGPAGLPRPRSQGCSEVPLIGFHLVDAIREGRVAVRGPIAELTAGGARFSDGREDAFDRILLATGYRAAVAALGSQIRLDECGFASRDHRVASRDQPDLYFVGHNYDTRGGLRNIARDARIAARLVAKGLTPPA